MDQGLAGSQRRMNKQLHDMSTETMISVWPRFVPEDRYFDFIQKGEWFEQLADGTPGGNLRHDLAGSDIDTTNPGSQMVLGYRCTATS